MMRIFSSKKVEIYFYIITHIFSILLGDILILLAMTIVDIRCTCHLISPTNKRKYSNSNNEESDDYSSDSSSDSSLEFEIDELDFHIDFKIDDILCEMSHFGTEKFMKNEVRRYFDEFKYYFEGLEAEYSYQNDSYQNIKMDKISLTFCNERIVKALVDQYISNNDQPISLHERMCMSDVDSIKITLVSLSRPRKCEWCLHRFFLTNHSYKINLMKGENAIPNFEANINLSAKCDVDDKLNELFGVNDE